MTAEAVFLLVLLAAALVVLYRDWLTIDLTAMLVLLALVVPWHPDGEGGLRSVLDLPQALSGFGSAAVAMIASMFVLAGAMERTGAAALIGQRVLAASSRSELLFQVTILTVVTAFSGLISDTTTVLVWMPMVLAVCKERGYAPSRVLLPLAFASLLGGQWTLIGTRSNVIASDFLRGQTGEGLGFLDFTPVAVAIWGVSLLFFVVLGRRFLPHAGVEPSLANRYEVKEYFTEVLATPDSAMTGKSLHELDLERSFGVTLLGVVRGEEHLAPLPSLVVGENDTLIVQGRISGIASLLDRPGMRVKEELQLRDRTLRSVDLRMVEAVVAPGSPLEGRTLAEADFRRRHNVSVLAVGHHGRAFADRPLARKLTGGDSLLLVAHEDMLAQLRQDPSVFLFESRPLPEAGKGKPYVALGLLAFVVVASAAQLLQPAVAMLVAAVAAVLTGCVGARDAYRAIDWRIVVVLGGMLPFGLALEETGTARWIAEGLARSSTDLGPWAVFAVLLFITIVFTQLIENAAAAAILAPMAYELALAVGADPHPFLLGMAICTSAGFSTPWAHESTLLVFGPGRYQPRHYLTLGVPFTLITWLTTALVVPVLFPLTS